MMTINYGSAALKDFMESLSAEIPVPAGGSACAVGAALAAGLVSKAASYTLGREKFIDLQDTMDRIRRHAQALRDKCLQLADDDAEAYSQVMDARKLPKLTIEEQQVRQARLDTALRRATDIPLDIAESAQEIAALAQTVAEDGNPALRADALVGAHFADAVICGCIEQVKENLQHIKDKEYRRPAEDRLKKLMAGAECKNTH